MCPHPPHKGNLILFHPEKASSQTVLTSSQLLRLCPFLSIRCFLLKCAPENPRFCPVSCTFPSLCEGNQIFPHNHQSIFRLVISLLHPHTIADQNGQLCPAPSFHLAPWWSLLLFLCQEEQLALGHQPAAQPWTSQVGTVHWEDGAEGARNHALPTALGCNPTAWRPQGRNHPSWQCTSTSAFQGLGELTWGSLAFKVYVASSSTQKAKVRKGPLL